MSSGLSAFKVYRSKININNHTDHQLKISFSGLTYNPMRRSTQTLKSEVESIKSGEKGEFRVFLGGSLEISIEAINEDGSPKEFVGAAPEYLIKVGHVTPPIDMEITPIEHYKSTGGKFENIKDPNISYIKVYDLSSNKHLVEIADVITNEVKPEQPRATWQMGMPLIPIEEIAKEKNLSELIQQTNFPEDLMRGEINLNNDLGYPVEVTIKKVNRSVAPQYQTPEAETTTIEKDKQGIIGYPSMSGSPNVEGLMIKNINTEEVVWVQEIE